MYWIKHLQLTEQLSTGYVPTPEKYKFISLFFICMEPLQKIIKGPGETDQLF